MAVRPWVFESDWLETNELREGYKVKIELGYQVTTKTAWSTGLAAPVFSADVRTGLFDIFTAVKIPRIAQADLNALGSNGVDLMAENKYIGTDGFNVTSGNLVVGRVYKNEGYTTVTHSGVDYVDGQYFTAVVTTYTTTGAGTVEQYHTLWSVLKEADYEEYTWHVRISTQAYGGTYVYRFWGVIDPRSLMLEIEDSEEREYRTVKVKVIDSLQMLSQVNAFEWMELSLTHATYDYDVSSSPFTGGNVFTTAVSTYTDTGISYYPGRYLISSFVLPRDASLGGDVWVAANNLRWIKLVDIIESVSDHIAFEASVNNGGLWSDNVTWRFYYNNSEASGSGGTTLQAVTFDQLYVISQVNKDATIYEELTFFDPSNKSAFSLKTMASPLEVLKKICVSFGLVARTRVNAAGERYLEVREIGIEDDTVVISDNSEVGDMITIIPNDMAVDGVKVPSYGSPSDVIRGNGESSNSVQFDQLFTLANNFRAQYEFKRSVGGTTTLGYNHRPGNDFFASLWTLTNITTKTAEYAYSICAIMPKSDGQAATSDPGNIPDYGEYDGTLSGVVYPPLSTPSVDNQYWVYIEVMAMALAHYMYNDVDQTSDPVGFARKQGIKVDASLMQIDHTQALEPPYVVSIVIDGQSTVFWITESEEDLGEDNVRIKGHTRTI